MEIRILVADPFPVVRAGLQAAVRREADLSLIDTAESAAQTMHKIRALKPDVVVAELQVACGNGLPIARIAAAEGLATRLIVFSGLCRGADVYQAIGAGAAGYLTKTEPLSHICAVIRQVHAGRRILSPDAQAALQDYLLLQAAHGGETGERPPLLTDRELEVLQLTAAGLSIGAIGRRLGMSASTVKNHRQSTFAKLNAANAPAAVYEAMRRKLLT